MVGTVIAVIKPYDYYSMVGIAIIPLLKKKHFYGNYFSRYFLLTLLVHTMLAHWIKTNSVFFFDLIFICSVFRENRIPKLIRESSVFKIK